MSAEVGSDKKVQNLPRLVFSRFFDIRKNLGNVKENLSCFLPFTDSRNPTILV